MIIRLFNTYEPVTTFYRDLIPYWLAQGWQVEVVISRAEYRAGRGYDWIQEGVTVRWTRDVGNGRFQKLLTMLFYLLSGAIQTLFARPVDRNVFLTQPPLFFLWGYVLRLLRRQPYYIVLMDIYPDVLVKAGVMPAGSLATKLLTALSRFGIRQADGVIVIGRHMADRVAAMGVPRERIHFVPNWTDETAVRPISHNQNPFRQQQGWQDKFVILYSGNIGVSHTFDDILQVALRWRKREDIVFAFIGQGQRRQEIEKFKTQHQLNNIQLLPFQPQEILTQSLSAGDIHFVSLRDGFEGIVVPSKSYGILSVGRPILYQGQAIGEIARMISENQVGATIPLDNPNQLEQTLQTYVDSAKLIEEQSQKARQVMETQFSRQMACQRYTNILR